MTWLNRMWNLLFYRHPLDVLAEGYPGVRRDLGEIVLWSMVNRPRSWTLTHNRLDHSSGLACVWADGCMVVEVERGRAIEGLYLEYLIPAFDAHPEVVAARRSGRAVD